MRIVTAIAETTDAIAAFRSGGASIAFVPTMGALHDGHLSLVDHARAAADITVMSIFVNPLQFAPTEDLSRYPRPVELDEKLARNSGVDVLFRPGVDEMYPGKPSVSVTAGGLGSMWEGSSRPGHFDGVLTVVTKLFNIVRPDIAVFGRKDLQQAALIESLVRDLDFSISVQVAPIVRDTDGLAMSSRNGYLSPVERVQATALRRALQAIERAFDGGERSSEVLEATGIEILDAEPLVKLDYLAIVDVSNFARVTVAGTGNAVILAARVGKTRLIDNSILGVDDRH